MIRRGVLKVVRMIVIVLLVTLGTTLMLELVPGDVATNVLGEGATAEQYDALRQELGLDQPVLSRYGDWLGNAVTGDFGRSIVPPVTEVSSLISARLPITLEIAVLAMLLSLLAAVPLAMWTAYQSGGAGDRLVSGFAFGAISVPPFLSALLVIFLFVFHQGAAKVLISVVGAAVVVGIVYGWTERDRRPSGGREWARSAGIVAAVAVLTALIVWRLPSFPRQGFVRITDGGPIANLRSAFLPALTLALLEGSVYLRVLRADLVTTLDEDFLLSAESKGLPVWRVMTFHALRPSSLSLVTVAGVGFARLLGGTIIVEAVFNVPGMGDLIVNAIQTKDYPVVQAGVAVLAVVFVMMNALVDLTYAYLDPRIRARHV
ncbi:MAG: ABC transporter permease [Ilumatobacteraceae bacterium]|nr:ABC transporter permease [Ilumatobacteraceae bacterium]